MRKIHSGNVWAFLMGALSTLTISLVREVHNSTSGERETHKTVAVPFFWTNADKYVPLATAPCSLVTSYATTSEIAAIELHASEWLYRLPYQVSLMYDGHSLPDQAEHTHVRGGRRQEGMAYNGPIHDTIADPKEPGSKFENKYEVFGLFPPAAPCKNIQRLGNQQTKGEGKSICAEWRSIFQAPSCTVYSLGGNNEWEFEESIVNETACTVHTFDCTITPRVPGSLQAALKTGRLVFHKWCVASTSYLNEDGLQFLTLSEIGKSLGHDRIHLLKMDIEAFEHDIINSWTLSSSSLLPEIFNLEYHDTTVPLYGRYRRKAVGEIALEFAHLHHIGLRLVLLENSGGGAEATFVRTMCPA